MNIQALKSFNTDKALEIEELVGMSADLTGLLEEYETLDIVAPDWITAKHDEVRTEIGTRTRAADMAELHNLENQIESLKSATEKRQDATKRLAALQSKLGLTAKSGK